MEKLDLYYGIDWKKEFKAPTDSCFALKYPQIQKKSSKYIKYICCENQKDFKRWINGIRIAKFGKQLYDNYKKILELIEINKITGRFPINMHNRLSSSMNSNKNNNHNQQNNSERPQSSYSIISTSTTATTSSNSNSNTKDDKFSSKLNTKNNFDSNLDNHNNIQFANRSVSSCLLNKRNSNDLLDVINDTTISGYENKSHNGFNSSQYSIQSNVEINNNHPLKKINLSYTEQLKSLLHNHQDQQQPPQPQPIQSENTNDKEKWHTILSPISVTTNNSTNNLTKISNPPSSQSNRIISNKNNNDNIEANELTSKLIERLQKNEKLMEMERKLVASHNLNTNSLSKDETKTNSILSNYENVQSSIINNVISPNPNENENLYDLPSPPIELAQASTIPTSTNLIQPSEVKMSPNRLSRVKSLNLNHSNNKNNNRPSSSNNSVNNNINNNANNNKQILTPPSVAPKPVLKRFGSLGGSSNLDDSNNDNIKPRKSLESLNNENNNSKQISNSSSSTPRVSFLNNSSRLSNGSFKTTVTTITNTNSNNNVNASSGIPNELSAILARQKKKIEEATNNSAAAMANFEAKISNLNSNQQQPQPQQQQPQQQQTNQPVLSKTATSVSPTLSRKPPPPPRSDRTAAQFSSHRRISNEITKNTNL